MVLVALAAKTSSGSRLKFQLKQGIQRVGRDDSCDFVIPDATVSAVHAEIDVTDSIVTIKDIDSTNGVFIGAKRVKEAVLNPGVVVRFGTIEFLISDNNKIEDIPMLSVEERKRYHSVVLDKLNADRVEFSGLDKSELENRVRNEIAAIIKKEYGASAEPIVESLIADILGLGPLDKLLCDSSISEIMVNGPDKIFIERAGKLELSDSSFISERQVREVIERIVLPLGRRIDEGSPIVDARLKDGSRVNAVIPPLALDGSVITIRKFSSKKLTPEDLVKFGSANPAMIDYLKQAVLNHRNIVISGGTGSGKTTLLNIIASFIPENERVITIEDAAELSLAKEHVVRLEARASNIEGKGAVSIRDLVRNALRMRPDRIVIGECRGGEALDMLQAMNTGHDGSLTTGHANTPVDMVRRLEVMVLLSGVELPVRAIREQISSAVHIIVQQSRLVDGRRKITAITEVQGMDGENIKLKDVFRYDPLTDTFSSH